MSLIKSKKQKAYSSIQLEESSHFSLRRRSIRLSKKALINYTESLPSSSSDNDSSVSSFKKPASVSSFKKPASVSSSRKPASVSSSKKPASLYSTNSSKTKIKSKISIMKCIDFTRQHDEVLVRHALQLTNIENLKRWVPLKEENMHLFQHFTLRLMKDRVIQLAKGLGSRDFYANHKNEIKRLKKLIFKR